MNIIDEEFEKLNNDIIDDIENLVEKYMEIVGLDIPEYDEIYAKEKLLKIIKKSIKNIEDRN